MMRLRQGTPSDKDEVANVLIAAFPQDRAFWDYRYPFRDEFPEDHRRYITLLAEGFLATENEDYLVVMAELPDPTRPDQLVAAAVAVWKVTYINTRKYGPGYIEFDRKYLCPLPFSSEPWLTDNTRLQPGRRCATPAERPGGMRGLLRRQPSPRASPLPTKRSGVCMETSSSTYRL